MSASTHSPLATRPGSRPEEVFGKVVVGVDATDESLEACRQAGRLVSPEGRIELLMAVHVPRMSLAGESGGLIAEALIDHATEAIRRAGELVGAGAETRLVCGRPLPALLHELARQDATLAVVGTHGHGRTSEIAINRVAGELIHEAPCSVLVARKPVAAGLFPRFIVAGVDGSPASLDALAVAEAMAERHGAKLRVVCAMRAGRLDRCRLERLAPGAQLIDARPVDALVVAAREADVLVVGSRGLHGIRALGSVSERVAHRAPCSVLVVRGMAQ